MSLTPKSTAAISIASNTLLVGTKLVVGLISGSVSIISEAIHSSMDLLAALIAFFSVSVSSRPPDKDHNFGHGKIENVSGVIEALLILVAAGLIVYHSVRKIIHGGEVEKLGLGLAVMGLSAVVNIIVSRILFSTAKRYDSIALEADAHHLATDVYTSLGVFVGLLLVKFTGIQILDPIAALAVAALIGWLGFDVLRRSFVDLLDRSLPSSLEIRIMEILESHSNKFMEFHKIRTRKSGPEKHIDMHLVICRNEIVERAHALCDIIQDDIETKIPRTNIMIHTEPCEKDESACTDCELNATRKKT